MGEMLSLGDVADLAEQLHLRPSGCDFERPIATVCEQYEAAPPELRRGLAREVLSAVIGRIGAPTLYGGGATGPVVRWRGEKRTVLLDSGAQGLQLSVRHTVALEAQEAEGFELGERADPASYYVGLPYLWQLYRGSDSLPFALPRVAVAPDWRWLQESLRALLDAWWEQLPAQIGRDGAGFNVVPCGGRERGLATISVLCSEPEGVMLLVDDRNVPGGTPGEVMEGRGWRERIMGWWQRDFYDLGVEGAAAAARMAVEELHLRGVPSPEGLGVEEVRCEGGGLLVLPGLAIGE